MILHPSEDSVYGYERGIFGKILRRFATVGRFMVGDAFMHQFAAGFTAYQ